MPISYREEQYKKMRAKTSMTSELIALNEKKRADDKVLKSIRDVSSPASLFMELAVQASELSNAAMKMASHYAGCRSKFPDEREVYKVQELLYNVIEEYSDVQMVSRCIGLSKHEQLWDQKLSEWCKSEGVGDAGEEGRHHQDGA